ncbi:DUF5130 domain-containing protein [Saccharothrix sp. S26]|uniref:DUF5130 family protein n=1 Tax=Saccharothrix sp. S26 TaxID=2907215 RepID=UPI001F42D6BF|nr:DUF5130 family protein [Saccharothrix sp. S26]MCE6993539.1 DUF5130 domain-containing protein [Saccharothrix sp. S26]
MATGELTRAEVDPSDLPMGAAVTNSGRISAAKMYEPHAPSLPFTPVQLASLDEALTLASRTTGLDFSVYLGELGSDSRLKAEELHASTPRPTHAVLIAVSPGERRVEVVTGEESHRRIADRGAKLAVMSMVASFKEGDLAGGLVSGLRMLADQAGQAPKHV